ncbi:hypothetical protein GCM10010244_38440 [Streptomyces coeruleorubidus]|nr:hypothetical protein GCM10010244_38440 [Streptomyces bellus]
MTPSESPGGSDPDDYDRARHFIIESGLRAAKADGLQAMEKKAWEANGMPQGPCLSVPGPDPSTPRTEA